MLCVADRASSASPSAVGAEGAMTGCAESPPVAVDAAGVCSSTMVEKLRVDVLAIGAALAADLKEEYKDAQPTVKDAPRKVQRSAPPQAKTLQTTEIAKPMQTPEFAKPKIVKWLPVGGALLLAMSLLVVYNHIFSGAPPKATPDSQHALLKLQNSTDGVPSISAATAAAARVASDKVAADKKAKEAQAKAAAPKEAPKESRLDSNEPSAGGASKRAHLPLTEPPASSSYLGVVAVGVSVLLLVGLVMGTRLKKAPQDEQPASNATDEKAVKKGMFGSLSSPNKSEPDSPSPRKVERSNGSELHMPVKKSWFGGKTACPEKMEKANGTVEHTKPKEPFFSSPFSKKKAAAQVDATSELDQIEDLRGLFGYLFSSPPETSAAPQVAVLARVGTPKVQRSSAPSTLAKQRPASVQKTAAGNVTKAVESEVMTKTVGSTNRRWLNLLCVSLLLILSAFFAFPLGSAGPGPLDSSKGSDATVPVTSEIASSNGTYLSSLMSMVSGATISNATEPASMNESATGNSVTKAGAEAGGAAETQLLVCTECSKSFASMQGLKVHKVRFCVATLAEKNASQQEREEEEAGATEEEESAAGAAYGGGKLAAKMAAEEQGQEVEKRNEEEATRHVCDGCSKLFGNIAVCCFLCV